MYLSVPYLVPVATFSQNQNLQHKNTQEHNLVSSQILPAINRPAVVNDCPTCWEMGSDGKCIAKKGAHACFKLTCDYGKMELDFSSDLFGVSDFASPYPFTQTALGLRFSNGRWRSSCALGGCGMKCQSRTIDGEEFIVFGMQVSVDRAQPITIGNFGVFMQKPVSASIQFECAYKQKVTLNTADSGDGFTVVGNPDHYGSSVGFGAMEPGFSMQVFVDAAMTTPVSMTSVFVGAPIYTQITWNVPVVTNVAGFFVNSAYVTLPNGQRITLIADNCYSTTFGVVQLQPTKLVTDSASFKFTSFVVGARQDSMRFRLTAEIMLCSLSETKCQMHINNHDMQCPHTAAYNYRALTYGI